MRLVESNKVDNNIISNLLENEQEGRYYDVVIGFGGYIGVEEEYHVYAMNRADAVGEALDNPGSEAEQDLSVDNIEDNGDGSYTCTVSFAGTIGADNEYTVYADSEEEAEMNAIEEAKSDLEVISVDGKEFSYDDDSNFNECDKPKTKDKEKLKEAKETKKYTKEEIKAFAESINTEPLTKKIRQVAGISDLNVEYEIEEDSWNDSYRILVETGSVKKACGLVAKVKEYRNINICNFTTSIDTNDNGELEAYIQIDLNLDGGHGGALFYATYSGGRWTFTR